MLLTNGSRFKSREGSEWEILEYHNSKNILCRSTRGYVSFFRADSIRNGQVKCRYHPSLYGVGHLGEGNFTAYLDRVKSKEYMAWGHMLGRCYSPKVLDKQCTYRNCTVHPEWHDFQKFAAWYSANYFEDCHLDKDIKFFGNTIYSEETCLLVTRQINNFLLQGSNRRGSTALGTNKYKNKFRAEVANGEGKNIYLGQFETEKEAFEAYASAKEQLVNSLEASEYLKALLSSHLEARHSSIRETL